MPPIGTSLKARVTQTDVARAAGVHNTTVSLALRNSPSIPESTRKRIRAIADELGYYPDPTLQALVAYRKGRMPKQQRDTLAYITNWNTRWGWRAVPAYERTYAGAQRKAAALGYQLEHFWLGEPGMTQRRLSSVLYHRNITGVLIASQSEDSAELSEIDWPRLSVVKIGCLPQSPLLHRVTDDHSGMARFAIRRVLAAGFERVGLVMTKWWDEAADEAWSAGYFAEQTHLPSDTRIPFLALAGSRQDWASGYPAQPYSPESMALAKWYEDYRPDVVLAFSPIVLTQMNHLGLAVQQDVGYVDLSLECSDGSITGFRHNSESIGEVAVATLVAQLQQNALGIPSVATTTLVGGTWFEGSSLPTLRLPSRWAEREKSCIERLATAAALTA